MTCIILHTGFNYYFDDDLYNGLQNDMHCGNILWSLGDLELKGVPKKTSFFKFFNFGLHLHKVNYINQFIFLRIRKLLRASYYSGFYSSLKDVKWTNGENLKIYFSKNKPCSHISFRHWIKVPNIQPLLIFYRPMSFKFLEQRQPFINFLSLNVKKNIPKVLRRLWAKVTYFGSMSESFENILLTYCYDSDSNSIFKHSPFPHIVSLSEL